MFQGFLITIISSAVVSTILAGLLLWLTKSWISERLKNAIKSEYDQKLETHKSQLKAHTDSELEKLKTSLSTIAAEQRVKFSTLHNDRAKVIAKTYAYLKEVYLTMHDYVKKKGHSQDKPIDERRQIAVNAHSAFREYYRKKLIYLPKIAADKLETIDSEVVEIFHRFLNNVELQQGANDANKWDDIFEKMNGEMQDTFKELEDDFRRLLGDES